MIVKQSRLDEETRREEPRMGRGETRDGHADLLERRESERERLERDALERERESDERGTWLEREREPRTKARESTRSECARGGVCLLYEARECARGERKLSDKAELSLSTTVYNSMSIVILFTKNLARNHLALNLKFTLFANAFRRTKVITI